MIETIRILIIHADSKISENLQKMLHDEGHEMELSAGISAGIRCLKADLFHIVLLDAALSQEDQQEVMEFINQFCPETLVIQVSWYAMLKSAIEAIHSASLDKGDGLFDLQAIKMTINRLSRSIRGRDKEKESQREVLRMAKDLQESNQRLMEMDKKKNNCLAVATHELRTPITIVNGYLKLLLSESFGDVNEKQRHLLKESSNYCSRLIALVNSMLDRCRLNSGSVEFEFQRGSYQKCLQKVVGQMENYIQESGLLLAIEVPDKDAQMTFDPNAIEQILINLIGNAVKFTPPPGKITVRCEIRDDGILTQVIDTGVGIEAHEIDKVFDEFNNVGKKHGENKGAGLGLSICKRIIHDHQGEIWVDSQVDKGSCFSFLLPNKIVGQPSA
jgi:signal transduction histidine kinase